MPYPEATPAPDRSISAGYVCLLVGLGLSLWSNLTICLLPLYLAAFILAIVGMTRGRIASGVLLIVLTIFVPIFTFALDIGSLLVP